MLPPCKATSMYTLCAKLFCLPLVPDSLSQSHIRNERLPVVWTGFVGSTEQSDTLVCLLLCSVFRPMWPWCHPFCVSKTITVMWRRVSMCWRRRTSTVSSSSSMRRRACIRRVNLTSQMFSAQQYCHETPVSTKHSFCYVWGHILR